VGVLSRIEVILIGYEQAIKNIAPHCYFGRMFYHGLSIAMDAGKFV
jgi:hypothetical protein